MTPTPATPKTTVATAEWTSVGDPPQWLRPNTLTTGDRNRFYYETDTGDWWTACRRCDADCPGTVTRHRDVMGGRCLLCGGTGLGRRLPGGLDDALDREHRNWLAAQARDHRATRQYQHRLATGDKWRTTHPALALQLADIARAAVEHPTDVLPTELGDLTDLAHRVLRGEPLTDRQTTYAAQLVDQFIAAREARGRRHHAGTVGQALTVTGNVAVTVGVSGPFGSRLLIVVDGLGEHAGVTVKTYSAGAAAQALARGDQITVTGQVTHHRTYQGVPQTELARPTFTRPTVPREKP